MRCLELWMGRENAFDLRFRRVVTPKGGESAGMYDGYNWR
jgi:hypothetical protein